MQVLSSTYRPAACSIREKYDQFLLLNAETMKGNVQGLGLVVLDVAMMGAAMV